MDLDEIIQIIEDMPGAAISVASSVTTDHDDDAWLTADSKSDSEVDAVFDLTRSAKHAPRNDAPHAVPGTSYADSTVNKATVAAAVSTLLAAERQEGGGGNGGAGAAAWKRDDILRFAHVPSTRGTSRFADFFESQIKARQENGISEKTEFFFETSPVRAPRPDTEQQNDEKQ